MAATTIVAYAGTGRHIVITASALPRYLDRGFLEVVGGTPVTLPDRDVDHRHASLTTSDVVEIVGPASAAVRSGDLVEMNDGATAIMPDEDGGFVTFRRSSDPALAWTDGGPTIQSTNTVETIDWDGSDEFRLHLLGGVWRFRRTVSHTGETDLTEAMRRWERVPSSVALEPVNGTLIRPNEQTTVLETLAGGGQYRTDSFLPLTAPVTIRLRMLVDATHTDLMWIQCIDNGTGNFSRLIVDMTNGTATFSDGSGIAAPTVDSTAVIDGLIDIKATFPADAGYDEWRWAISNNASAAHTIDLVSMEINPPLAGGGAANASQLAFSPAGGIAASNTQAAVEEVALDAVANTSAIATNTSALASLAGKNLIVGEVAPVAGDGVDGDYHLIASGASAGELTGPKASGAWPTTGNRGNVLLPVVVGASQTYQLTAPTFTGPIGDKSAADWRIIA